VKAGIPVWAGGVSDGFQPVPEASAALLDGLDDLILMRCGCAHPMHMTVEQSLA